MNATARGRLGVRGEAAVADYLERAGFEIVGQNVRVGRLEIDLIARRGSLLVFCEVRTRTSSAFVDPIVTIDRAKCQRIRRAARTWLAAGSIYYDELRFDAASVLLEHDAPVVTYYESAF